MTFLGEKRERFIVLGVFGKVAGAAAQHAAAATVAAGGLASFVIVGVVVVPSRGVALTPTYQDGQIQTTSALTEDQNALVDALRRLIASAHAIIDVRQDGDVSEMVLWIEDHRDLGMVNEDEVLIVTYAPLLEAVLGLSIPPVDEAAPAMTTAALFSDSLSAQWRRRAGVQQSILAANVTAMRMESVGRTNAGLTVRVSLTFNGGESDDDPEHRAEAMFVATLPAVARSR